MNKQSNASIELCSFILLELMFLIPINVKAQQIIIKYGDCIQGSIISEGQIDNYRFTGNKNDVITVQTGRATGNFWPQIEVYAPNGSLLKRVYNAPSARIDTLSLKSDGSYSILVTDGYNGTLTGDYGLCLQHTFNPGQAISISYGTTVRDTIHFAGYMNAYTFSGNQNDVITVQMGRATGNFWPQIEVYAPNGSLLKRVYNAPSARIDTLRLSSDGSYTILATDGYNGSLTGIYSLNLTGIRTFVEQRPTLTLPKAFQLKQNYPNPFGSKTTITYLLPQATYVVLSVYDVLGKEVALLISDQEEAGIHQVHFDAINLANGNYFYRLEAGNFAETKKFRILK